LRGRTPAKSNKTKEMRAISPTMVYRRAM
jgi:hypothetical protein